MRRICGFLLGFSLLASGVARAQELATARGLSDAEIGRLGGGLGSDDPRQREASARALQSLHEESLPGIEARLAALRQHRPSPARAREVLAAFRHAVGSRRADDQVDIAPGVLPVLAEQRGQDVRAMAEPLLLARALETMGSAAAGRLLGPLLAMDEGLWAHEARLVQQRMGLRLLPALITLRSHADPWVKRWAQRGVRALDMDDPARACEIDDPRLLADVVSAYGDPLDFAAMPLIVRLVDSDRQLVRRAARETVARFGKNAIWQLRELYEEITSQPADKRWGHERTARELYAVLDRRSREEAATRLAKGLGLFVAGELEAMATQYDRLLARMPELEERGKMAPGYASLGAHYLATDRLDAARDAYQRALRLSPEADEADAWKAQVAFIDAERAVSRGVVDLAGYTRALALDPEHDAAARAHDLLSGAKAARERTLRRAAAAGAAVLLIAFVVALLRRRQPAAG